MNCPYRPDDAIRALLPTCLESPSSIFLSCCILSPTTSRHEAEATSRGTEDQKRWPENRGSLQDRREDGDTAVRPSLLYAREAAECPCRPPRNRRGIPPYRLRDRCSRPLSGPAWSCFASRIEFLSHQRQHAIERRQIGECLVGVANEEAVLYGRRLQALIKRLRRLREHVRPKLARAFNNDLACSVRGVVSAQS